VHITADAEWAAGFLLAMVRAVAWVFTCPPFGTQFVPTTVKLGLAGALTVAMGPHLEDMAVPLDAGHLVGAAVLQVFAGVALGFIGILLFSSFQAAGSFIDLFGGFTVAQLYDPLTQQTTSVFGRFYQLLAMVLLFATGGHLLLVRGFLDSFAAAPLTVPDAGRLGDGLAQGIGHFFLAALEIAAPLLGALFLADVAIGLLARAAPDMNVFLLGLPVKLLLTLSLVGATIVLLPGAVAGVTDDVVRAFGGLLGGG
jgi:flagellar biosynthetic protein FliR